MSMISIPVERSSLASLAILRVSGSLNLSSKEDNFWLKTKNLKANLNEKSYWHLYQ